MEGEGDLLVLGVALDFGFDLREVESIALKQIAHALGGGLQIGVIEGSAELQTGGVLELSLAGRHFDFAVDLDGADEPLLGRAEHQRDTVAVGDRFDLDVGVVAGAVEAFDRFADFGQVEGVPAWNGTRRARSARSNGLRGRVVPDFGDRPAFEFGRRREVGSSSDDCEKTAETNSAAARWAYLGRQEHVCCQSCDATDGARRRSDVIRGATLTESPSL